MGLPLIAIGTATGRFMPKSGPWMQAIKSFFGLILLAMAVWLLNRALPPLVTTSMWAVFAGGLGIFALFQRQLMMRLGGGAALLIALLLAMTALNGNQLPFYSKAPKVAVSKQYFHSVQSLNDLQKLKNKAAENGKILVLDFYADWCLACQAIEHEIFNNRPLMQGLAGDFMFARVDLTNRTAQKTKLSRHFDVVAPPAILFIGPDGRELKDQRLVGEVSRASFKRTTDAIR
jgi:thiol:disulfide interchange protein DsbD